MSLFKKPLRQVCSVLSVNVVEQKRQKTSQQGGDIVLPAWPKQKKHWLKRCGPGLVSQCELVLMDLRQLSTWLDSCGCSLSPTVLL